MKLGLLVPHSPRMAAGRTPSGGDVYDASLVQALVRLGHEAELIYTGVDFEPRMLAGKLLAAGYDALIQDELGYQPYLALNRALGRRLPRFALVHVTAAQLQPTLRSAVAERAYLKSVQGSIFVSRDVRRQTQRLLGVTARGLVLPPGADHLGPVARRRSMSRRRELRCLCVGHVLPHKRQSELIALSAPLGARVQLLLAGDDRRDAAYGRVVRRAAAQHGPRRVQLLGPLDRRALARAYQRADVCVSASDYESYGIALTEALVHGLPVVTWTAGGLWEFLVPGVNALRVRRGQAKAFTRALASLAEDRALLARLQEGARTTAAALPRWDDAAQRLTRWLTRQLLATARP
ncbi:MAG: glycosyltransferase family 4 protein [Polyangiales bacterium]